MSMKDKDVLLVIMQVCIRPRRMHAGIVSGEMNDEGRCPPHWLSAEHESSMVVTRQKENAGK